MKFIFFFIVSFVFALEASAQSLDDSAKQRLEGFRKDLKQALVTAIRKDGLESAVSVCKEVAPQIAERYSDEKIQIGRSSSRIRNPKNQLEPWMQKALRSFPEKKPKAAVFPYFETHSDGGNQVTRYAEPIYLEAPCLHCHGTQIKAGLKKKIASLYSGDQAVGFENHELRGLFWLMIKEP